MKRKTSRVFSLNTSDDIKIIINQISAHLSSLTEDVAILMDNGITLNDNVSANVVDSTVTSGVPTFLSKPKNATTAIGATILDTGGAKVTGFTFTVGASGSVAVVVDLSPSPSSIKFAIYGK